MGMRQSIECRCRCCCTLQDCPIPGHFSFATVFLLLSLDGALWSRTVLCVWLLVIQLVSRRRRQSPLFPFTFLCLLFIWWDKLFSFFLFMATFLAIRAFLSVFLELEHTRITDNKFWEKKTKSNLFLSEYFVAKRKWAELERKKWINFFLLWYLPVRVCSNTTTTTITFVYIERSFKEGGNWTAINLAVLSQSHSSLDIRRTVHWRV